ncbi:Hpt domain-containing protein [filamentous cyanobacterium LEGE 11480]|uniref:Hpt domain-containing protein n=1 Tax=Romeriopsis navalis LEGE 11480 TaxID=2777977 RepID=A0A928VIX5_9CYAN|nr:Hpt domain-containing protein [Romeriopsis navalis]MBE9029175.1 Hpt domain-containing protein [Romeriopsis navalis LEGE 11480]
MSQPSDPTRTELPIDWQQLRQLSDGNEEFELELLNIFVTEMTLRLRQAQQAILHSQSDALAHLAHQMKGSSGNLGMGEIVRLSRELEAAAQTQNWEDAANQVEKISRSLNFIQNFLQP